MKGFPHISESAVRRVRAIAGACLVAVMAVNAPQPAWGNPAGGVVVAGSATIGPAGSTLTINQSTTSAIINWQQFSIAGGETTKFIVPSALSATLNRVTGGNPSQIYGNLTSNGIVYLVNPSGIVVGPSGRIDTAGFMASTLDVSNQQFLNGGNLEFAGTSTASISNQGTISASMGDVYLIASQVGNTGTISAPQGTAGLAAGSDILFQQAGSQHLFVEPTPAGATRATGVTNAGTISAAAVELRAAGGNAYALAINNSGLIAATGYKKVNGQVYLTSDGGNITNSGSVKAATTGGNGGTITFDGTAATAATGGTVVNSGTLDASATAAGGQGGPVTLKSLNGTVALTGAILARGGTGGSGGSVELSAARLTFAGSVDTSTANGTTGMLLLDPATFTVAPTGGDETGAQVGTALGSNNVTLSASQSVTVNDTITWTASTTLTLQTTSAASTIAINAAITGASGGLTIDGANNGTTVTTNGAGAVDVANFILQNDTTWTQVGTLPAFTASASFELQDNSTFLRASSGSGTSLAPYVITDVYGLQGIGSPGGSLLASDFVLGNNIDASVTTSWNNGAGFSPIAGSGSNVFAGVLNGGNFTVTGLVVNPGGGSSAGLFGTIGSTGEVTGLTLAGVQIASGGGAGALAAINQGTIENSSSSGSVTGQNAVGGLVGDNEGTITGSFSTGNVTGNNPVGGLVGTNNGSIGQSYSTATVTGAQQVGGLVGADSSGISNSFSDGTVTASATDSQAGGLVGYLNGGSVTDSYATTSITGGADTGALIGLDNSGSVVNSFWDIDAAGIDLAVGSNITNTTPGIVAATTAQLETQAFVTNHSPSSPAWDFTSVWTTGGNTNTPQLTGLPATALPTLVLDTLTGTAYLDAGSTLAPGTNVELVYDGNVIGAATTSNSGAFSFTIRPADLTAGVLLTGPANGNTYFQMTTPSASVTGADIWGDTLRIMADVASDTALADAAGNLNGAGIDYSGGAGNLNTATGVNIYIVGNSAQDGVVADYTLDGNIAAGGNLVSSAGSELTGTANVNLSGSSVNLAGTFNVAGSVSIASSSGAIELDNMGTAMDPAVTQGLTLHAQTAVAIIGSYLQTSGGNFSANGTGYASVVDNSGISNGVDLDSSTIDAQGGNINIQGQAGYILNAGSELAAGAGVSINQTTLQTSANGSITISGNAGMPNTGSGVPTGTFTGSATSIVGVSISNNAVISTDQGNLNITGQVNSGETIVGTADIRGVQVVDGGVIETNSVGASHAGNLTITGNTSGSTAYDDDNLGIALEGYDSTTSTAYLTSLSAGKGGSISLNGTAGTVTSDSAANNPRADGVRLNQNVTITAAGNASITIQGHGGTLTSTDGSDLGSAQGVSMYSDLGGSNVISSASGAIDITGTAGTAPNGGVGVHLLGANTVANQYSTTVESATGNITINGNGGSGFAGPDDIVALVIPNYGLAIIDDVTISAGTGAVSLTGTGGPSSSGIAVVELSNDAALDANPDVPTLEAGGALTANAQGYSGLDFNANVAAASASLTSNYYVAIKGPLQNTAGSVFIQAPLVTLDAAIDATAGNTVIDDTSQFIDNAGAGGLLAGNGFLWQVWSVNPAGSGQAPVDNDGGLTPDYIQYAASYPGTTPDGSGNGLLYSYSPSALALTLPGTFTKTYDATGNLTIAANSYSLSSSGLVTGDAATLVANVALTGTLNSKNVTTANTVTISPTQATVDFTQGSVPVYGYTVSSISGAATVTPATVTATLKGTVSKVYNGTTTVSNLAPTNYTLTGVLGTDFVTVSGPASGTYASPNAGPGILVTSSTGLTLSGAQASDYVLAGSTASGNVGTIIPATITADLTGTITKVYDDTTAAANLTAANYSLTGVVGGDSVTVTGPATGTYSSKNVGTAISVTSSTGLALSGAQAGDYTLSNSTATGNIGTITPASVTATLKGTVSKVYNGTTTVSNLAPTNYTLTGLLGTDFVTVSGPATGTYANPNAGSGILVTSSTGLALSGAQASDYTLTSATASGNVGTIIPATITAGLTGTVDKVYDGTTAATLANTNYTLTGVIGTDTVTLNDPTSGTYNNATAGSGKVVTVSGVAISGASASDYVLAGTTISGAVGTIDPATLVPSLTGSITKVYDGTTGAANLTAANYSLSGVVSGDSVTLTGPATGAYANQNVGSGIMVTSGSGLSLSGAQAGDYTLANNTASGAIGDITPATITADLTGSITRVYDGTTSATNLTASNYTLSGVVSGDSVTVTGPATGTYANQNAGSNILVTSSTGLALSGAQAGDYTLGNSTASGDIGAITPASVTASLTGSVSKVYDGTTDASNLTASNYALSGVLGTDSVSVSGPATGTYSNQNVGSGYTVTSSPGLVLSGPQAIDYTVANPTASGVIGTITPAPLTAELTGVVGKVYDGTTAATLTGANYVLAGVYGNDDVQLNDPVSGTYDTAAVGVGKTVTVDNLTISGSQVGDYTLLNATAGGPVGLITAADPPSVEMTSGSNLVSPAITPQSVSTVEVAAVVANSSENQPPPAVSSTAPETVSSAPGGNLASASGDNGQVASGDAAQLAGGQLNNVSSAAASGALNQALGPAVYQNLADALDEIGDWADGVVPPLGGKNGRETILNGGDVAVISDTSVKSIALSQAPAQLRDALAGTVLKGMATGTGH